MKLFEKHPKLRLIFAAEYLAIFIVCILSLSVGTGIIAVLALFCAYISVVKAGFIRDRNTDAVSNFRFDLLCIMAAVEFISEVLFR